MGYQSSVYKSMILLTQFSINMLVPIFLCSFLGIYLDEKLGTSFLVVILFFIGALAGFRNVYIFARKVYESKETTPSKLYGTNSKKGKGNEKIEDTETN